MKDGCKGTKILKKEVPQMTKKRKLKFNQWSAKRIVLGVKSLTSRKERYDEDGRVCYITPPLPWWFIKKYLFRDEGAVCPEELQNIINQC